MFERMRANVAGQKEGYYHLQEATKHPSCNTVAGCTALEMAQTDMYEWTGNDADSISTKLPAGQGVVCRDSTPDDGSPIAPACDNNGIVYAIKIWWTDSTDATRRAITTAAFK